VQFAVRAAVVTVAIAVGGPNVDNIPPVSTVESCEVKVRFVVRIR